MAKIIRIRCPGCGMLVNQKRLNEVHKFEMFIQVITSGGRGKIRNTYRRANLVEDRPLRYFKMAVAAKFREVADRLAGKVRDEYVDANGFPESDEDKVVVPAIEQALFSFADVSAPVEIELEAKGGVSECQDFADLSPRRVRETTPGMVQETTPGTVLEV